MWEGVGIAAIAKQNDVFEDFAGIEADVDGFVLQFTQIRILGQIDLVRIQSAVDWPPKRKKDPKNGNHSGDGAHYLDDWYKILKRHIFSPIERLNDWSKM